MGMSEFCGPHDDASSCGHAGSGARHHPQIVCRPPGAAAGNRYPEYGMKVINR
jgi:hypothetical protein